MQISEIVERRRRDMFVARYQCEHCGHVVIKDGHDAPEFYNETLPAMRCDRPSEPSE